MCYIHISNLKKVIGEETILDIKDLQLESGLCYGFVGRNGSGKSMLFKAICGYITCSGKITVDGLDIGKDVDFIQNAGVIIEQPDFLNNLSAFDNLKILAQINKKVDDAGIKATMEKVGLTPSIKKPVSKFSLGMKQRLRIAQAIMENPEILILDEPFNGLDEKGVQSIRDILLVAKKNCKIMLLTSHNKDDIDYLCDIVFNMSNGTIQKTV